MLNAVAHIGLTVKDMDRSVAFYRDTLGLTYLGELLMEGPETEALFRRKDCRARVSYLAPPPSLSGPPVELIQFLPSEVEETPGDLFRTSISELCFATDDVWGDYRRLREKGVEFLSGPQPFDFTGAGFGRSKAVYLRDPDGIILELIETV